MQKGRLSRKRKIRAKISGTQERPRLCVFRSSKHISAQIIDDVKRKTLVSTSDLKIKEKKTKIEKAYMVGEDLGQKAIKCKIKKVVFDRSGFAYHGRVKALAEGARKAGLEI